MRKPPRTVRPSCHRSRPCSSATSPTATSSIRCCSSAPRETRTKKDGGTFLKLTIGDRTGAFTVNVWDDVEAPRRALRARPPVHVRGVYEVHPKWGAAGPRALLRRPSRARTTRRTCATARRAARRRWRPTCASCSRRSRTRTCGGCSTASSARTRRRWAGLPRRAGGQALPPGLPRTACSSTRSAVAQAVSAISATFPGIDRDVAVTGALLHDIGKLEAYAAGRAARST